MATTSCPVCGMEFPEEQAEDLGAFKSEHEGRTVWLCSKTCLDTFGKDPAKWMARRGAAHQH